MNKVIIYLNGASKESGTTCFKIKGKEQFFQCPPGGYIGFQNSKTEHMAISHESNIERPSIQLSYFVTNKILPNPGVIRTKHFSNYPVSPSLLGLSLNNSTQTRLDHIAKIMYNKFVDDYVLCVTVIPAKQYIDLSRLFVLSF